MTLRCKMHYSISSHHAFSEGLSIRYASQTKIISQPEFLKPTSFLIRGEKERWWQNHHLSLIRKAYHGWQHLQCKRADRDSKGEKQQVKRFVIVIPSFSVMVRVTVLA